MLIVAAGFALRVWHNDYGLPFIWGVDEGFHFTNRAVDMFREGLDPGYYQNPAAYTYLVYALLKVMYGPLGFIFDLPWRNVTQQFNKDPTEIWIAARTLAAALGAGGVVATYAAARRIWGVREALAAAALLSFAFLPVAYSRIAVTDVGSLIGVALALWGAVRAYEDGRLRWYLLAGGAGGLALAFKYTAGFALLPLGIAAATRLPEDRGRAALRLVAGLGLAVVVFVALEPYLFGSLGQWWSDLRAQAEVAANEPKPGQESGGFSYYLDSLTWGFGWAAALAALAGAAVELRRDWRRGLLLAALPVALFVYLSLQSRYFGRWLLPAYPALAMLGGVALTRAADLLPRGAAARAAALALLTGLVLVQPLAADVRTAQVLGREDTREQVRSFLADNYPPELRVAIEPAVPGRFYRNNPDGRLPPWLHRCPRRDDWPLPGWSYPAGGGKRVCRRFRPGQFSRPDGAVRASAYHQVVNGGVIDEYRQYGYCLVVTFGVVRERALDTRDPDVRAYYDRLERESDVLRRFSPYDKGAKPVPFHFDLSFNYYPTAYHRPGPVATVYRLRNCKQAYGPPPVRLPKANQPPRHIPSDGVCPATCGARRGPCARQRDASPARCGLATARQTRSATQSPWRDPVGGVAREHERPLRPPVAGARPPIAGSARVPRASDPQVRVDLRVVGQCGGTRPHAAPARVAPDVDPSPLVWTEGAAIVLRTPAVVGGRDHERLAAGEARDLEPVADVVGRPVVVGDVEHEAAHLPDPDDAQLSRRATGGLPVGGAGLEVDGRVRKPGKDVHPVRERSQPRHPPALPEAVDGAQRVGLEGDHDP